MTNRNTEADSRPGSQPGQPVNSYGQIVRSSALMGGATAAGVVLGIIRTKVLALLLGPSGMGILGILTSTLEISKSITSLGLNESGVRQIATSVAAGNDLAVGRTAVVIRRVTSVLAFLGATLLFLLRVPISRLSFGTEALAGAIGILALGLIFTVLSISQTALLQGLRKVQDLAKVTIFGAACGTVFSIPIVYFFREAGVAPSLTVVAATGFFTTLWYARKAGVARPSMSWSASVAEASELLKLGFAFMTSGVMSLGSAYLVRVYVLRGLGADAAGFYQAAWTIAGMYVGFILQAMGTDFFPRLTMVSTNNPACNKLVNEQAEVGLLIAIPGVLFTLSFAPVIIYAFYSPKFGPAIELLRWSALGMLCRVASFPVGYIIMAKGRRSLFILVEFIANLTYLVLVWKCVAWLGLRGTGIAFLGMYLVAFICVYFIGRHLSGFRWSRGAKRHAAIGVPCVLGMFVLQFLLPTAAVVLVGMLVTVLLAFYSLKQFLRMLPWNSIPGMIRRLLTRFGLHHWSETR